MEGTREGAPGLGLGAAPCTSVQGQARQLQGRGGGGANGGEALYMRNAKMAYEKQAIDLNTLSEFGPCIAMATYSNVDVLINLEARAGR